MDRAERLIHRLPDHGFRCIGHDVWPVQVIGMDRVGLVRRHRLVHDSDGHIAEPHILPDGRGGSCAGGCSKAGTDQTERRVRARNKRGTVSRLPAIYIRYLHRMCRHF